MNILSSSDFEIISISGNVNDASKNTIFSLRLTTLTALIALFHRDLALDVSLICFLVESDESVVSLDGLFFFSRSRKLDLRLSIFS